MADEMQQLSSAISEITPVRTRHAGLATVSPPVREQFSAPAEAAGGGPSPSQPKVRPGREPDEALLDPGLLVCWGPRWSPAPVRCSLSLLLAELDHVDTLLTSRGADGIERFCSSLEALCEKLEHRDRFALPMVRPDVP